MNESSTSWVAILTLRNEGSPQASQQVSEPYILSKEEATFIGRSKDCQIYLEPGYSNTSRYHAKLKLVDVEGEMAWLVWDLETPNGTFVNNQKIENYQQLQSGDRLTLGKPNGASFIFEWKAIELTQLNEIFRQKPSYDKTIIPSPEELKELEESTQSSAKDLFKDQVGQHEVNLRPGEIVKSINANANANANANDIIYELSPRNKKSAQPLKLFAKGIGALIFILISLFLIYRIPESIEAQKRSDNSLASYINNVSGLLLDKKLSSLDSFDLDARKARESANAQTLTTLRKLDGETKGTLLRFLHGAKLIKIQPQALSEEWLSNKNLTSKQVVRFLNQDLTQKELVYIRGIKINKLEPTSLPIFLTNQNLLNQKNVARNSKKCTESVKIDEDNLGCAWALEFKTQAYAQPFVTPIQLSGADLTGVTLRDAPLERVNLEGAYISFQNCKQNLSGNFFVDTFYKKPIDWLEMNKCSANLSGAGLQDSRLFRSILMGANLRNAKLDHADLRQVDLRGADLNGVSWQGALLKGACYLKEDWQKYFPEKGPNGEKFDPVAAGMKAVSRQESDFNNSLDFKECKNISASSVPTPGK
jgi:uncharacterized protein YjbI with pentapeptide repeats/pSer/pThr/pTyr-binding forkhead associated (FHA) protein